MNRLFNAYFSFKKRQGMNNDIETVLVTFWANQKIHYSFYAILRAHKMNSSTLVFLLLTKVLK